MACVSCQIKFVEVFLQYIRTTVLAWRKFSLAKFSAIQYNSVMVVMRGYNLERLSSNINVYRFIHMYQRIK